MAYIFVKYFVLSRVCPETIDVAPDYERDWCIWKYLKYSNHFMCVIMLCLASCVCKYDPVLKQTWELTNMKHVICIIFGVKNIVWNSGK